MFWGGVYSVGGCIVTIRCLLYGVVNTKVNITLNRRNYTNWNYLHTYCCRNYWHIITGEILTQNVIVVSCTLHCTVVQKLGLYSLIGVQLRMFIPLGWMQSYLRIHIFSLLLLTNSQSDRQSSITRVSQQLQLWPGCRKWRPTTFLVSLWPR